MSLFPPKIYGLIGYPVQHSFSPVMHNAAFKHLGINAEYRLFPVKPEELEAFLLEDITVPDIDGNKVRAKDILGFNITIPHKVRAREIWENKFPFKQSAPSILEVAHYVKISGAINTVRRADDKCFNTDAPGFIKSLESDLGFTTNGKNVLVLGCGGAGRAVVAGLSWKNNKINQIFINDISNAAIESAKSHFSAFPYIMEKIEFISREQIPGVIKNCQLLVNASPVGMNEGDGSVVDKDLLHEDLFVYDVVYNRETQLIKDAKSKGLNVKDGKGMLARQGKDAFELWTRKQVPIEIFEQALNQAASSQVVSS